MKDREVIAWNADGREVVGELIPPEKLSVAVCRVVLCLKHRYARYSPLGTVAPRHINMEVVDALVSPDHSAEVAKGAVRRQDASGPGLVEGVFQQLWSIVGGPLGRGAVEAVLAQEGLQEIVIAMHRPGAESGKIAAQERDQCDLLFVGGQLEGHLEGDQTAEGPAP